jgi:2,4-dienoyl-CoA reductase-like NADH-dependent reductase (Old Yellow Enzyme family)
MSITENHQGEITGQVVSETHLFSPLHIRSITFRNRLVVSPMCMYSSEDGFANDWHLVHLGSRAVGGAGLVFTEAIAVEPHGRISPNDLGIWKDEHIEMLSRITAFIKQHGAVPGTQLAHAGRKASTQRPWDGGKPIHDPTQGGWKPVGPSPIPFNTNYAVPDELSHAEIQKIKAAFAAAARRALQAGFEVIEVHGAHGYLLHEFLSPISNQRTDEYGGNLENRERLMLEVVQAIRKEWPEHLPLMVRLSATDWLPDQPDSWKLEDTIHLSARLKNYGVDMIDVSSGGNAHNQQLQVGPGYQVEFAKAVRREAGIMTTAVGLITGAEQADRIVRSGQADMVAMARELLRDPYFPLHAARELGHDIRWPDQYLRAK